MLDITDDPFYSSKFGVVWAEDHIAELELETEAFFQPDAYAAVTETDADGTYNLLKLKLIKPMPRALNGHVIDVVYNLRASLDQAIYAVATLNNTLSGTPYFPIRTLDTDFETALNKLAKNLPQEISDLVRSFKPYKGGNDLILALHKLCNTNKHGIIRPLPVATYSMEVSGTSEGRGPHFFLYPQWDRAKNEMVLGRVPVNSTFTVDYDYTFVIAFDEIEFVYGQPVISTLHELADIVKSIVMAIEAETVRIGLI